jgi:hypothetical protein
MVPLARYDKSAYLQPGVPELCAHAHGWPLTSDEVLLAAGAAQELLEYPPWIIWAWDLDISMVPLHFSPNISILLRVEQRAKLERDPLGGTWQNLPHAFRDREMLLGRCPRKSDGVGRSSKPPLLRNSGHALVPWDAETIRLP